jgi:hypothetical protein
MRRIGALLSSGFEEPARFEVVKHRFKAQMLGLSSQKARPKLAQDRAIKARIGQVSLQRVFPVNTNPHCFCRWPVR